MNRKIKFSEGEYYHIYNRGVEKRTIFINENDYKQFIYLLNLANCSKPINTRDMKFIHKGLTFVNNKGETFVDIGVYCLMPNHFHLLLKEKQQNGISNFMKKLLTAYTMYFNKKHNRKGTLWEGVFQAEHVSDDNYLKYLYSYIHLNPVKLIQSDWKEKGIIDIEKTLQYLDNFKYSSYLDYMNFKREENIIINKDTFPEYFISEDDFKKNVFDWLTFITKVSLITKVTPL